MDMTPQTYDFTADATNAIPLLDDWLICTPVNDVLANGFRVTASRVHTVHKGATVWITGGFRLTSTTDKACWLVRVEDVFAVRHAQ